MIDKVKSVLKNSGFTCVGPRDAFVEPSNQFSIVDFGRVKYQNQDSDCNSVKCFYLMTHPNIFSEVQDILSENFNDLEIKPDEYNPFCTPTTAHCLYDYK